MKTVIKFNKIPRLQKKAPVALEKGNITAAERLVRVLQRALDEGKYGVQSDTRALALSLYVKATNGRNDYDDALAKALEAFTTGHSRHHGHLSEDQRKDAFEKIKADYEPLPAPPDHVSQAAVATMLAYGNKLEFDKSWMENPATIWAISNVPTIQTKQLQKAFKI